MVTFPFGGNGKYPSLFSGSVAFTKASTLTTVTIDIPKDIENHKYTVDQIILDSGSTRTIIPQSFAKVLNIAHPDQSFQLIQGIGGCGLVFESNDLVKISIGDGHDAISAYIFPLVLVQYAPYITCEIEILRNYGPYKKDDIIDFISPTFRYSEDNYKVEIISPERVFHQEQRRLELEVHTGKNNSHVLIGRDWQSNFEVLFKQREAIITKGSGA